MSTNAINPVGTNPIYSAGIGAVQNSGNAEFEKKVANEIAIKQAELKVVILNDMLNAKDTTTEQRNILQAKLNDANREFAAIRQKLNVG